MQKKIGKYVITAYNSNLTISYGNDENRQHATIYCTGDEPQYSRGEKYVHAPTLACGLQTQRQVTEMLKKNKQL